MGSAASTLEEDEFVYERLREEDVKLEESTYWASLLNASAPSTDLLADVREKFPLNIRTLFHFLNEQLKLRPVPRGAVNLITNLFPLVYTEQESDALIDVIFWEFAGEGNQSPLCQKCNALIHSNWIVCPFCSTPLKPNGKPRPPGADGDEVQQQQQLPVPVNRHFGEELLDTLFALLFIPGQTIAVGRPEIPCLWAATARAPKVTTANRILVTRLLISMLSQPLYAPAPVYVSGGANGFAETLASRPRQFSEHAFNSFLWVVCSFNSDSVVPYNHVFTNDPKEKLLTGCLDLLLLLLNSPVISRQNNVFRSFLRTYPADQLLEGVTRIVVNPFEASNTKLPASKNMLPCHKQALVLLYNALQESPEFLKHLLSDAKHVAKLLPALLQYISQNLDVPREQGLINLCVFLILRLSSERKFGIDLNSRDPTSKTGTLGDSLIQTLEKFCLNSHDNLRVLDVCVSTIMSNVSPYQKSISAKSAVALIHIVNFFARKSSLLARGKTRHTCLYQSIATISNLLQHQYAGNHALAYAVINYRDSFYSLLRFKEREDLTLQVFQGSPAKKLRAVLQRGDPLPKPEADADTEEPSVVAEKQFQEWRSNLPLSDIIRFLDVMVPMLEQMKAQDEQEILRALDTHSNVGLSTPRPIEVRRPTRNQSTDAWLAIYAHGLVYVNNPKLFSCSKPTLFSF